MSNFNIFYLNDINRLQAFLVWKQMWNFKTRPLMSDKYTLPS